MQNSFAIIIQVATCWFKVCFHLWEWWIDPLRAIFVIQIFSYLLFEKFWVLREFVANFSKMFELLLIPYSLVKCLVLWTDFLLRHLSRLHVQNYSPSLMLSPFDCIGLVRRVPTINSVFRSSLEWLDNSHSFQRFDWIEQDF